MCMDKSAALAGMPEELEEACWNEPAAKEQRQPALPALGCVHHCLLLSGKMACLAPQVGNAAREAEKNMLELSSAADLIG